LLISNAFPLLDFFGSVSVQAQADLRSSVFDIDISELARTSGVPASTLRYYEEKGLIASVGRRGLKRLFEPSTLERLSLIALGQASGFSLDEMAAMLAAGAGGPAIDKEQLRLKADDLDRRIADLSRMRDGLRHAVDCPSPTLLGCPRFRKMMRVAGHREPARRTFRARAV
jgi:MerR family redox-sensitive transcriptional activator SoxR